MPTKKNPKKIVPFKERCYSIYHNLIIEIDAVLTTSADPQNKVNIIREKIRYGWGERMVESAKSE